MTTHKEEIDIPDGWTVGEQHDPCAIMSFKTGEAMWIGVILTPVPPPDPPIKPCIGTKIEILAQNVNLLIQDVRTVQAKLDAMGNRLTSNQWFHVPSMTPIDPPPYGTILGPVTCEAKSFAEKEYSDNTAPKEEKPS